MSELKVSIDLDRYSSEEIIAMVEQGLLTREEVRESGRATTLFNDDLRDWLKEG